MYNGVDPLRPAKRIGVETTPENGLFRANRRRLREWLGTGIDNKYGKQLVGVEEDADGGTSL